MTEKKYPRLNSYPMALREKVTPITPNYLEEYAKRPKQSPMSLEKRQINRSKLLAHWEDSQDT